MFALDDGVDVNHQDEHGNSLLVLAAQTGNKRTCKLLLRRGADVLRVNLQGNSVLHYCFEYHFTELADYLMSKGGDDSLLNAQGLTCYEGINAQRVAAI